VHDSLQKVILSWPTVLNLRDGSTDVPRSWIQLAKTGSWTSKRYGKFSITREDLAQMYSNFTTITPKFPTELPIDYDHLSMPAKKPGDGVAAGWMKQLQLRANGEELWAEVEWTEDGAARIRKKEYRFISPSFVKDHEYKNGQKIGTTLLAAAVTNHPFLEGMQALTLYNFSTLGDLALDAADAVIALSEVGQRVMIAPGYARNQDEVGATFEIAEVVGEGEDAFVSIKDAAGVPHKWFRATELLPASATPANPVRPNLVPGQGPAGVPVAQPAGSPLAPAAGAPSAPLTPEQIAALTPEQIAALTPEQRAAVTPEQLATMTPEQQAAMTAPAPPTAPAAGTDPAATPAADGALPPEQIAALTTAQIAALTPEAIRAWTPEQKAAVTEPQRQVMTPEQLAALDDANPTATDLVKAAADDKTVAKTPKKSENVTTRAANFAAERITKMLFKLRNDEGKEVSVTSEQLEAAGIKVVPEGSAVVAASELKSLNDTVISLSTRLDEMSTQSKADQRRAHTMSLHAELDRLSNNGLITKPQRDLLEEQYKDAPDLAVFMKLASTFTIPVVKLNTEHGSGAKAGDPGADAEQKIISLANQLVKDEKMSLRDATIEASRRLADESEAYRAQYAPQEVGAR
jgi:hypothetical protein